MAGMGTGRPTLSSFFGIRPRPEREIAFWLADQLATDLGGRGIFVAREVEIRVSPGGYMGESVDILVEAVAGERVEGSQLVQTVIELKCCWHEGLDTAMRNQLVSRYLDGDHNQGIYLVAHFDSPRWSDSDAGRRRACRKRDLAATRAFFAAQATDVSSEGLADISAYTLDCSLGSSGSVSEPEAITASPSPQQ
jgi:hypothetical protein